jgi:hypothetical protein
MAKPRSERAERAKERAERELEKVRERAIRDAAQPVPPDPAEDNADAHYPCPADGSTLYGWTASKRWDGSDPILLDHCEDCGLVVSRARRPPDVDAELAALERKGEELVVPNRGSWAAWLGAAGWADLAAGEHRLHLTRDSLRLLLAKQGTEVLKVRTPFSLRSYRGMLQTMINAFTLRKNFARHVLAGTLAPRTTTDRLTIALDGVVTVLTAVPLSVVALLVEGLASISGRGDLMRVRTAPTAVAAETGSPRSPQ